MLEVKYYRFKADFRSIYIYLGWIKKDLKVGETMPSLGDYMDEKTPEPKIDVQEIRKKKAEDTEEETTATFVTN